MCRDKLNSPSVFSIIQFGINCSISSMKNYYSNRRLIPESLFLDLCHITKINELNLKYEKMSENWGKIKGGKSRKI